MKTLKKNVAGGRAMRQRDRATSMNVIDRDLLKKVAKARDKEAFAELYRLNSAVWYGLLLRMLGNRAVAQDALQEGTLRVWRFAHTFDENKGDARSWLMRVMVRAGMSLARQGRSSNRTSGLDEQSQLDNDQPTPFQAAQKDETHQALGTALAGLAATDRQILTLYYGADFSQDEIATSIGMPPRTVSERIKRALNELRKGMTHAGFTSVASGLLAEDRIGETLKESICFPEAAPALSEKILGELESVAEDALSSGAMTNLSIPIGIFFLASVTLGAGWIWNKANSSPSPSNQTSAASPSVTLTKDGSAKLPLRHWDFNVPDLEGLNRLKGSWEHLPAGGPDGSGCMKIKSTVVLTFDRSLPRFPFLVSFKSKQNAAGSLPSVSWQNQLPEAGIGEVSFDKIKTKDWSTFQMVVTDRWIYISQDHHFKSLVISTPDEKNTLRIGLFSDCLIDDLVIDGEVKLSDPSLVDHPISPMLAAVNRIPKTDRRSQRILPELTIYNDDPLISNRIFGVTFVGNMEPAPDLINRWTFNKASDLADFAIAKGNWKHLFIGDHDDHGVVEFPDGDFRAIFTLDVIQLPVLVTARFKLQLGRNFYPKINILRSKNRIGKRLEHCVLVNAFDSIVGNAEGWVTVKTYISSTRMDYWVKGRRVALLINSAPLAGPFAELISHNSTRMDFLEVKSIAYSKMPPLGPYRIAFEKHFGVEGAKAKLGDKIYLPGLKPFKAGQKVYLEYLPHD